MVDITEVSCVNGRQCGLEDSMTLFFGGAGMFGSYIEQMVQNLTNVGVKGVIPVNYTRLPKFFGYKDTDLEAKFDAIHLTTINHDLYSFENNIVYTNNKAYVHLYGEYFISYAEYLDKTITNIDLNFSLNDIGVYKTLSKNGQFNLIGYSYGSVVASQVALHYSRLGDKVNNLVLIGSPINKSLLNALKRSPMIKSLHIMNLTKYGDPIYAGMTDVELVRNALVIKKQQKEEEGHFYYARKDEVGKKRRKDLAKIIFNKGIR